MGIPLILLEGSSMCNAVVTGKPKNEHQSEMIQLLKGSRYFTCPNSSEDLASMVHLLLTIEIPKDGK